MTIILRRMELVVVLLVLNLCGAAFGVNVSNIIFYQMDFYGNQATTVTDTAWGDLEFDAGPDLDLASYYANLLLLDGSNSRWVIRNMGVPSSADLATTVTLNRFFDLGAIGVTSGTQISLLQYDLQLTTTLLDSAPPPTVFTPVTVANGTYDASGFATTTGTQPIGDPGSPPPSGPNPTTTGTGTRSSGMRTNMPDLEEGINQCASVSIARSLRWLHNRGDINLGAKTNQDITDELEFEGNWTQAKGIDTLGDLLSAKLEVTSGMPLTTKFQVNTTLGITGDFVTSAGTAQFHSGSPSFEYIKSEFLANEDVEVGIAWRDASGNIRMGHMMTVVGFDADTSNGLKQLWLQDDEHQGTADTRNRRRSSRYEDSATSPTLTDLPTSNTVQIVLSESPTSTPDTPVRVSHLKAD